MSLEISIKVLDSLGLSVNKGHNKVAINSKHQNPFACMPQAELDVLLKAFPKGVIAFDLETTGLSPLIDQVVEISAVKVDDQGRLSTFSELVNPERPMPKIAESIHGISDDMVKDKKVLKQILPDFLSFCESFPLLAHNAKFDVGFLVFAMHTFQIGLPKNQVFCSCQWSRHHLKGMRDHKLFTLATTLEIPLDSHHRALDDAYACLRIVSKGLLKNSKFINSISNSFTKHPLQKGLLLKFSDFHELGVSDLPENLSLLRTVTPVQTIIDLKYKGGSFKNQFRPVRPISLLPMPAGNVLYALCLKTNIYKFFAMKKIKELRSLSEEEIELRLQEFNALKKNLKLKNSESK